MKRPTSERTLTAEQFNQALQALGWKQADFARRVGMTPQTVGRWSSGHAACPLWLTEYLGAMQDLKALCARYLDRPDVSGGATEDPPTTQPPARLAHALGAPGYGDSHIDSNPTTDRTTATTRIDVQEPKKGGTNEQTGEQIGEQVGF